MKAGEPSEFSQYVKALVDEAAEVQGYADAYEDLKKLGKIGADKINTALRDKLRGIKLEKSPDSSIGDTSGKEG